MNDYINPLAQYIRTQQQQQAQSADDQRSAALIEALRASPMMGGGASAPAQTGNVVSANAPAGSLAQGAQFGTQLGQAGKGLYNAYQGSNFGTANRYGTDLGSQQTGMLQAQDAAFYS